MNNWLIGGLVVGLLALLGQQVKNYFTDDEWQGKLDEVNPDLPPMLNELRFL